MTGFTESQKLNRNLLQTKQKSTRNLVCYIHCHFVQIWEKHHIFKKNNCAKNQPSSFAVHICNRIFGCYLFNIQHFWGQLLTFLSYPIAFYWLLSLLILLYSVIWGFPNCARDKHPAFVDPAGSWLNAPFMATPIGQAISEFNDDQTKSFALDYIHDYVCMTHACASTEEHWVN